MERRCTPCWRGPTQRGFVGGRRGGGESTASLPREFSSEILVAQGEGGRRTLLPASFIARPFQFGSGGSTSYLLAHKSAATRLELVPNGGQEGIFHTQQNRPMAGSTCSPFGVSTTA